MNNVLKSENAEVKPNIILESQDIEKNEIKKLKGDIIGDTLYSGKWIINILFSISKVRISFKLRYIYLSYIS